MPTSNDDMAAGAMQIAGRKGLDVPGDISVSGFDDTPVARTVWPPMTTVAQPIRAMGERAVQRLVEPTDEAPDVETLDFELVLRESTATVQD